MFYGFCFYSHTTDLYHECSRDLHVYSSKVSVPAVDDDRPCGGRVGHLDSADERQQSCGVVRHSVIGPAGEMELLHLSHLIKTPLWNEGKQNSDHLKKLYTNISSHSAIPLAPRSIWTLMMRYWGVKKDAQAHFTSKESMYVFVTRKKTVVYSYDSLSLIKH